MMIVEPVGEETSITAEYWGPRPLATKDWPKQPMKA